MSANPIWIAGYFGPVAGASPVWIAPGDGTVPSAVQSEIVSYYAPIAGATAVWIAGFFAPPPAAIGATPITISGWGGSGGGGPPPVTSVWSAADAAANGMTLSNGGLTLAGPTAGWGTTRSTVGKTTGKLYVEFICSTAGAQPDVMFGLATIVAPPSTQLGHYSNSVSISMDGYGVVVAGGYGSPGAYTPVYTSKLNDVFSLAVDFDAGKIWFGFNNTWVLGGLGADERDPVTGTNPVATIIAPVLGSLASYPAISLYAAAAGTWTLQSTAASQKYAPPSGFKAWDAP